MKRGALIFGTGLLLGVSCGYFWAAHSASALTDALKTSLVPIQVNGSKFTLVRPLLAYRTPEATLYGEYTALDSEFKKEIAAAKAEKITNVSIYFRDLDTARWVGVNETMPYHPASLLKVPILIAYYKEAEINPSEFRRQVVYHTFSNLPPFEASSTLVVGQSYSIESLLEKMIIDSDNGAAFTLLEQINPDLLNSVYQALGIVVPDDQHANDYEISARTYGLFFRVLYNATYLSPAYSQKALALLARARFTDGIVAGVPSGTTVAHKYGEHVIATGDIPTGVELSDCGVVYYPDHPYLLCVMTRTSDTDLAAAAKVISSLSNITYLAVADRYKK